MIDYSEIVRQAMYIAQISEDNSKRCQAQLAARDETIERWKTENRQLYEMFTKSLVLLKECINDGLAPALQDRIQTFLEKYSGVSK